MENPLENKSNTPLILVLVASAVTAGALAYLYYTESGTNTRKNAKHRLKHKVKDIAVDFISEKTGISKKALAAVAGKFVK